MIEVSTSFGRLRQGISPGYGYMAIVIAALAGREPVGTLVVAFLFGGFIVGALRAAGARRAAGVRAPAAGDHPLLRARRVAARRAAPRRPGLPAGCGVGSPADGRGGAVNTLTTLLTAAVAACDPAPLRGTRRGRRRAGGSHQPRARGDDARRRRRRIHRHERERVARCRASRAASRAGAALASVHAFFTVTLHANQIISRARDHDRRRGARGDSSAARRRRRPGRGRASTSCTCRCSARSRGSARSSSGTTCSSTSRSLLVPAVWWTLRRTRVGLHLRAVGENPAAADAMGVSVARYRYGAVLFGGALAGLAGASLSLAESPGWSEGMTAGRGWIALALVIFATWDPLRVLLGALPLRRLRRPRVPRPDHRHRHLLDAARDDPVRRDDPGADRRHAARREQAAGAPGALGTPYLREG